MPIKIDGTTLYTKTDVNNRLREIEREIQEVDEEKVSEPSSEGTSGQVLTTDGNGGRSWTTVSGGGGGTTDFNALSNRPQYNGTTMTSSTNIPEVKTATWDGKQDALSSERIAAADSGITSAKVQKLDGVESGAEVNIIETVRVNGTALTPSSKAVDVSVPTATSDITNDSGFYSTSDSESSSLSDNDYAPVYGNNGSRFKIKVSNLVNAIKTALSSVFAAYSHTHDDRYYTETETDTLLASKQDTLSDAQLNAANSGITSNKVSTYDGYGTTIAKAYLTDDPAWTESSPLYDTAKIPICDVNAGNTKKSFTVGNLKTLLNDLYIQEPSSEGTSGQVLTTDGDGVRTWTTTAGASAYCESSATESAKTASCIGYTPLSGSYTQIVMKFSNTYEGALTLNVNSQGAKPIYINGEHSSSSNHTLRAGSYIVFYNGSAYFFRNDGKLTADITGNAQTSTTATAATTAKNYDTSEGTIAESIAKAYSTDDGLISVTPTDDSRIPIYYYQSEGSVNNGKKQFTIGSFKTILSDTFASQDEIEAVESDIQAINVDSLGDVHAKSLDVDELPKVSGFPMFIFGTAAPTITPDYIGQAYIDTTNKICYSAVAVSGSVMWKAATLTSLSELASDATHRVVTDIEKVAWTNAYNPSLDTTEVTSFNDSSRIPILDATTSPATKKYVSLLNLKSFFDGRYYTETEIDALLASKQAALTTAQLNAANSGITSSKVSTYDGYSSDINGLDEGKVDKVSGKGLSTNDYTDAEQTKLSGIAAGAEVNQNAFANVVVDTTTIESGAKSAALTFVAGNGILIAGNNADKSVTITNNGIRTLSITETQSSGASVASISTNGGTATPIKVSSSTVTTALGYTPLRAADISGKQDAATAVTRTQGSGAGSSTNPVYVDDDGKVQDCSHILEQDVLSTSKLTDTVTAIASTTGSGNAVTAITASNGQLTITKGTAFLTSSSTLDATKLSGTADIDTTGNAATATTATNYASSGGIATAIGKCYGTDDTQMSDDPADADRMPYYDASASAKKYITYADFKTVLDGRYRRYSDYNLTSMFALSVNDEILSSVCDMPSLLAAISDGTANLYTQYSTAIAGVSYSLRFPVIPVRYEDSAVTLYRDFVGNLNTYDIRRIYIQIRYSSSKWIISAKIDKKLSFVQE